MCGGAQWTRAVPGVCWGCWARPRMSSLSVTIIGSVIEGFGGGWVGGSVCLGMGPAQNSAACERWVWGRWRWCVCERERERERERQRTSAAASVVVIAAAVRHCTNHAVAKERSGARRRTARTRAELFGGASRDLLHLLRVRVSPPPHVLLGRARRGVPRLADRRLPAAEGSAQGAGRQRAGLERPAAAPWGVISRRRWVL